MCGRPTIIIVVGDKLRDIMFEMKLIVGMVITVKLVFPLHLNNGSVHAPQVGFPKSRVLEKC